MFNLVIFGPPGAGKGTQSIQIAEKYHLAHISTGDIFRREIKNETPLGMKVKGIIEKGELVPDELLIDLLRNAMHQVEDVRGFVFDGFPRTIRQAGDLDLLLQEDGEQVSLTLALEVDEQELITRLLIRAQREGRKDDTREVIANRLEVYHRQTSPLIEYYQEQGKFKAVYGQGTIGEIFDRLCREIDTVLSSQ
ncbi:MAG: adenylate kinase [Bacteroidales bacterium]|nr:adenylate kinase [Lentimicrobiaceae bacterium]MDD5693778.1 adenylate kinase [Bacteroidales bacterium]